MKKLLKTMLVLVMSFALVAQLPANVHAEDEVELVYYAKVDATCEDSGTKAYWYEAESIIYYLDENGTEEVSYWELIIPALGHNYVETITKEATHTESGEVTYTCSNCGDTYVEEIEPLDYFVSHFDKIDATCDEEGVIEYWVCYICDSYFADENGTVEISEEDLVIPLTHTLQHVEAKEPATTEAGNLEYWYCTECYEYFSDSEGKNVVDDWDDLFISKYLQIYGWGIDLKGDDVEFEIGQIFTDEEDEEYIIENTILTGNAEVYDSEETYQAIQLALENNQDIECDLLVKYGEDYTAPETDTNKIEPLLSSNESILSYFDLSFAIYVDGEYVGALTQLLDEITITITLPEDMIDKDTTYSIYRTHDGFAEKLSSNFDGSWITFKTNKFSTYAVSSTSTTKVTSMLTSNKETTSIDSGNTAGNTTTDDTATTNSTIGNVQTSDSSNVALYAGLVLVSLLGAAFFVENKKKFNK
ncbi:MAG: hypothetical protein LUG60_04375 [Erysipelotrichaceae bacterium]|nr:hypothetical protein [Erysipelotrichaceae bacterium]